MVAFEIMCDDFELSFSEEEVFDFLGRLLPSGFAGEDVMTELAADGWEHSKLVRAFHPSVEVWHKEQVAMFKQAEKFLEIMRKGRNEPGDPFLEDSETLEPPTLRESRAEFEERPFDSVYECREIVGRVLWEVFSDGHSVIADDGREIDLGSFRGASCTLDLFDQGESMADYRDDWVDVWDRGDCMRFYMGLSFIEGRTGYGPVYEMVFRRLQKLDADWICRFPRMDFVHFEEPESEPSLDSAEYNPSEAFGQELKKREDEAKFEKMQAKLDAAYTESAEAAAKNEPPPIIRAYRRVYARLNERNAFCLGSSHDGASTF